MIYLEVNGELLDGFTQIDIERSFQKVPAQFAFTATTSVDNLTKFPVLQGDRVKIVIDDHVFANGFIDTINLIHDLDSHEIQVQGCSKIVDLVESTMDGTFSIPTPVKFKDALEQIIKLAQCDIDVIDHTDGKAEFADTETISGELGGTVWSLMLKLAVKQNLLLTENSFGDVVITYGTGDRVDSTLKKHANDPTNNIMKSEVNDSIKDRFHFYQVLSQQDSADYSQLIPADQQTESKTDTTGQATDDDIRPSRRKTIVAETSSDDGQCVNRAAWQANFNQTQNYSYKCSIQGFFYENGQMIEPGQIIYVDDIFMNVQSDLIIDTVRMTYDIDGGSVSNLSMLLFDAFTLTANRPSSKESGNVVTDFARNVAKHKNND